MPLFMTFYFFKGYKNPSKAPVTNSPCATKMPKGTQILNSLSCVVVDGVEALVDLVILLPSTPGVDNFKNGTPIQTAKRRGKSISHQDSSLEMEAGMFFFALIHLSHLQDSSHNSLYMLSLAKANHDWTTKTSGKWTFFTTHTDLPSPRSATRRPSPWQCLKRSPSARSLPQVTQ